MKQLLAVCLLLCSVQTAHATNYYVNKTNGSASDSNAGTNPSLPWLTIGKCASTITGSDVCNVVAGTYDESVTETTSGVTYTATPGCPSPFSGCVKLVRFTASSGSNGISLTGFELTMSGMSVVTTGVSITATGSVNFTAQGNYIHDTADRALRCNPNGTSAQCNGIVFKNNVVARIGAPGARTNAVECYCENFLLEGNDVSEAEDTFRIFGHNGFIRNNLIHDNLASQTTGNHHVDAVQTFCALNSNFSESMNYVVVEGNKFYNNLLGSSRAGDSNHFYINNSPVLCSADPDGAGPSMPPLSATNGSTTIILRHNVLFKFSFYAFGVDSTSSFQNPFDHQSYYHNTIVAANRGYPTGTSGLQFAMQTQVTGSGSGSWTYVKNNILVDCCVEVNAQGYVISGGTNNSGSTNLAWMYSGANSYIAPISTTAAPTSNLPNTNPIFVTYGGPTSSYASNDFNLQSSSPARASGTNLTTVSSGCSGSTSSITLANANLFSDGFGVADAVPDEIAVGTSIPEAYVAITSINYSTGAVSLSAPISCANNDLVWLYKNSSGETVLYGDAPDIGALQTNWSPNPPTPGNSGTITVSSLGSTTLTLDWTKATDLADPQADLQYEVCQSTSNNVTSVVQCEAATIIRTFTADIDTFAVTGLTPLTTYYFNVVVKNTSGLKTAYATVNSTTICGATKVIFTSQPSSAVIGASLGTVSASIENSSNTVCTDNTSSITLSKNPGATWGTLVSGSSLTKSATAGVATWTDLSVTVTAGSGSIKAASAGLTDGVSSSITITAQPPVPGNSGTITTSSVASTTLTVNWTKATDPNDPQSSLEYEVCQSTSNNITSVGQCEAATIIRSFIADINTFNVTSLTPLTTYYFNVVVRNTNGVKVAYTPVNATTTCGASKVVFTAQPTTAVLGGTLAAVSVSVENSSNTVCTDNTSSITLSKNGGATWGTLVSGSSLTKSAVAGVATWNDLSITTSTGSGSIDAASMGLTGATSTSILITDPSIAPVPGFIVLVGAIIPSSITRTSIDLNWPRATDAVTPQSMLQYEVRRSMLSNISTVPLAEQNGTVVKNYTTDIASVTVQNLSRNTEYWFNVIVKNSLGLKAIYAMQNAVTLK